MNTKSFGLASDLIPFLPMKGTSNPGTVYYSNNDKGDITVKSESDPPDTKYLSGLKFRRLYLITSTPIKK